MSNANIARALVDDGAATFPCSAHTKRPLNGEGGFCRRSADRKQIEEWIREFALCVWGIVPADFGALSFDDDNAATRRILAQLGLTGRAKYRTLTPSGSHEWYRNVVGLTGGANLSLADVGLPMDSPNRLVTRIDAGYLIAPGCVRADGGVYRAIGTPADMEPLPDAVAYVLEHHRDADRDRGKTRKSKITEFRDLDSTSVIDAFNRAHSVTEILKSHDYKKRGDRWVAPTSSTGMPGVVVFDGERVYSHHGSDSLANGHANDAFDMYRILDHGGDITKAVRGAAEALGIAPPRTPRARTTVPVGARYAAMGAPPWR